MAPLAQASPVAVVEAAADTVINLDCGDSPLSMTANVISLLTLVVAVILGVQLSMASTKELIPPVAELRYKFRALYFRLLIGNVVFEEFKKRNPLGTNSVRRPNIGNAWGPLYGNLLRWAEGTRRSLEGLNELHESLDHSTRFGFKVWRPLFWLLLLKDRVARHRYATLKAAFDEVRNAMGESYNYFPFETEEFQEAMKRISNEIQKTLIERQIGLSTKSKVWPRIDPLLQCSHHNEFDGLIKEYEAARKQQRRDRQAELVEKNPPKPLGETLDFKILEALGQPVTSSKDTEAIKALINRLDETKKAMEYKLDDFQKKEEEAERLRWIREASRSLPTLPALRSQSDGQSTAGEGQGGRARRRRRGSF